MYTTCIFCHDLLGTNDHIEHFPVGRRLAFDSAKGRLWVVCQRRAQWNLAPLEERWEAVEDCERAFRAVRTRVSTAEIGLARLADGMDLVRVGAPLRPEFAAWRFGDQLGVRRRKNILRFVGGSAILGGAGMTPTMALTSSLVGTTYSTSRCGRTRARRVFSCPVHGCRRAVPRGESTEDTVQDAVSAIDDAGSAERFIPRALDVLRKSGRAYSPIWSYPPAVRLGIEMALHEEAERRAMAGELSELESAWREAERVATIADDLLLPPHVSVFMEKHRKRR